ncbi:hypothetical protein F5Y19DRAFT_484524 [Xylariaceae sp. FL1651]|nr:hypothetical protein F5Y19DRAFT_484524 [Xylariaceae sp. FL1651]
MTIPDISCAVCGGSIREVEQAPLWMNQFHALYTLDETSTSASLSGLGERLQFEDMIFVTSSEGQETHVSIDLMPTTFGGPRLAVPSEAEPSAWGFPFHCSCWELLKASSPTGDVHMQSLFDLCRSFPIKLGALDFGHDYGGLYQREHPRFYPLPPFPGEENPFSLRKLDVDSAIFLSHNVDPLDTLSLLRIVEDQEPSREYLTPPKFIRKTVTAYDPFGKLPIEILDYIFPYLSSADVLNFKISSRIIANIPLPDRFWHSRFCHGREFDYIFEFTRHSKHKGQWKKAFFLVQHLQHHPSLVNRKRIWGLATALHNLISRIGTCHGSALRSWFEQDAPSDSRTWVTASRGLKPYPVSFTEGSRSLYERFLALPEMLSSISVSVIDLFTGRYISGTQIRDINGNCWDLGYFQPHSSIPFTTMRILGLLLAEDQRGIRGIRVLSESGPPSEWIGEHQNIPQRRLVLPKTIGRCENPVKYIKGGFDACKMVSLAISGHADSADVLDNLNRALSLQDAAIWFPDIPCSEFSFFGVPEQQKSDRVQARPFQVEIFSDFTGSHLPHVTGIKLWTNNYDLLSLRVDLDKPLHGQTKVYLGTNESALELIPHDRDVEEHSFSISSADGERIVGLDVNYYCNGSLLGFEVHTSFNRAAQLPPRHASDIRRSDWKSVRLWPEDGHIIGFYGIAASRGGLTKLGIVCGGTTTLRQFPPEASDGLVATPTLNGIPLS